MNGMTNDQLRKLGEVTLHGGLPEETSRRVLIAAWRLLDEVEVLERKYNKTRVERDHMAEVLTRLATHASLDEVKTDGIFGVDRKSIEHVRTGLIEAGYLAPRRRTRGDA